MDGPSFGLALSVAVDSHDHVVAAGRTSSSGKDLDFTVAKWVRPGARLLWVRNLNGTANRDDQAFAVTVDSSDNVIAAGSTDNIGTGNDFTVAKWDPDGGLLWMDTINGTANNSDRARSVIVDSGDNIIAAGWTVNTDSGFSFTVAKWRADGDHLWVRRVEGTAGGFDQAFSVTVDSQDNVIAAGWTRNISRGGDFTVAKWDPEGVLLWVDTIDGSASGDDIAQSLVVDRDDNVIVAGRITNTGTGTGDFAVAKWNPGGALQWSRHIDGDRHDFDQANSVAVDGEDSVIAAGLTRNHADDNGDFTVAKWDADGVLLWSDRINGTACCFDSARSVVVDSRDDVIVAGSMVETLNNPAVHVTVFTVSKWDADGNRLWIDHISGNSPGFAEGHAIAVDSLDRPVAGGFTSNHQQTPRLSFTVVFSSPEVRLAR